MMEIKEVMVLVMLVIYFHLRTIINHLVLNILFLINTHMITHLMRDPFKLIS